MVYILLEVQGSSLVGILIGCILDMVYVVWYRIYGTYYSIYRRSSRWYMVYNTSDGVWSRSRVCSFWILIGSMLGMVHMVWYRVDAI